MSFIRTLLYLRHLLFPLHGILTIVSTDSRQIGPSVWASMGSSLQESIFRLAGKCFTWNQQRFQKSCETAFAALGITSNQVRLIEQGTGVNFDYNSLNALP
jgi:hypothetical protein